jgi:hypothetical protein
MPSLPRGLSALALLLAFALAPVAADELSDKQRKAAGANLKKGEVAKAVVVETSRFIVCATVAEAKAKVLGEGLEKAYTSARKGLQMEDKDNPWKGKLTVYYLTDRREFNRFALSVAGEKTRDSYVISAKGDEPFLINGPELGEKTPEADLFFETGVLVASATIQGQYAAALLPEWVKNGFARAAALRAAGTTSPRYTAYKNKARRVVLGAPGKAPAPMANLWNDMPLDDRETVATSLMDYIVFGPGAKESDKFLRGFLPSDTVPTPGVAQALEAAKWKEPQLEAAWRKWVQTGK